MANVLSSESRHCSRCGTALNDSADGLCVRCLLTGALTTPPEEEMAELESPATLLERREFAGYELVGEIARGGMGIVFRARQKRPDRTVALKVIATGELASAATVDRFRTEAEAAARLEHPNIVPVYEVGQHGTWHFFSMRLIEGPTLAQAAAGKPMPPVQAAQLMVKIARAVHHAHQRGILHRDLKPNNILLDAQGEPHLMDFGLAKLLENTVGLTQSDMVLGTPAYMAPEQAAGGSRDLTVAVDVYGLGAVLYEMLTGRPPFQAPNMHALLRMIALDEPVAPSLIHGERRKSALVRAAKPVSVRRKSGVDQLLASSAAAHALFSDLDVICLRSLEKDPGQRYHSAEQFADDLERALRHETIIARPSTRTQRLRKWVRRNPARAGLVATATAALLVLTVISLAFNLRLTRARNKAVSSEAAARSELLSHHLRENARLNASGHALLGMLPLIDAVRMGGDHGAVQQRIRERLSATMRFSPKLPRLWDAGGTPVQLQFSADGRHLLAVLRSGEPRAWDVNTRQLIRHPDVGGRTRRASFISPDGSRVLEYFREEPFAEMWNTAAETLSRAALSSFGGGVAAFSPDGKIFASGGERVRMWDTASGAEVGVPITNNTPCIWIVFSPDGQQLITGHDRNEAWRWDVRTGERLGEGPMTISPTILPRFSSDGERLLVNATGHVQVLHWKTNGLISSVPAGRVLYDMNFSPDGKQFATAAFYDHARVWDVETSLPYRLPMTHESGANKAVFSPDGALLATAGFDYQLRVVRAADHRLVLPAIHHSALIEAVAFSADSRFLAVGDVEGIVRVWDLQSGAKPFLAGGEAMRRVGHSEDGKRLVVHDDAGALHVYDMQSNAEIGEPWNVPSAFGQISLDAAGRYVVGAFRRNGLRIWDFSTRRLLHELAPTDEPATRDFRNVVFKPDGAEFVTSTPNGIVQRWKSADGKPAGSLMNRAEDTFLLYWSADGRWISAGGNTSVSVWDAQTSSPLGAPIRCDSRENITDSRFSPDGSRLVVSFANLSIEPAAAQLFELPSLRPAGPSLRHGDGVASTTFSADSKLVATGGEDNVARIWRAADGQPVTGALRHNGIVVRVLFSHDSRLLATGCVDGTVRVWDVERGEMIAPPLQLGGIPRPIGFTPDSTKLFVGVANAKESVWIITLAPKEWPLPELETLAECRTGFRADILRGSTPLSAAELAKKFSTLDSSNTLLASPADILRWHAENAVIAERQGAWFTAAFHLERLMAATPDDAALKERHEKAKLLIQARRF